MPSGSVGNTYLSEVLTQDICDNDLCQYGDDNEFEFTAQWTYGSLVEENTLRVEGIPYHGVRVYGTEKVLIARRPTSTLGVHLIEIKETDTFGDDHFWPMFWLYGNSPTSSDYIWLNDESRVTYPLVDLGLRFSW